MGMLESMVAIQKGISAQNIDLSEQELEECGRPQTDENCGKGAFPGLVIENIINYHSGKLFSEKSYPYDGKQNTKHIEDCHIRYMSDENIVATVNAVYYLEDTTERGLMAAVAEIGPVSIIMNFTDTLIGWGIRPNDDIYSDVNCVAKYKGNHAVVVVGYGTENSQDYWIIKNSWGENWGSDGFIRIDRKMTDMCGMAVAAITANIA